MDNRFFRGVSTALFCGLLAVSAFADVSASNSSPVTTGTDVSLYASSTDPADTFSWSGPNNFTSTLQNPTIPAANSDSAGTYTVTTGTGTATTVVSVNPQPTINIDNASGRTPAKGASGAFVFHITLSASSTQTVSVEFYTSNQTAMAPRDFQYTTGEAVFKPGETEQDVAVNIVGTNTNPQRTFLLNIYNPQNASIATLYGYPVRGKGTILAK